MYLLYYTAREYSLPLGNSFSFFKSQFFLGGNSGMKLAPRGNFNFHLGPLESPRTSIWEVHKFVLPALA
jgi:hypothetical protein